MASPQAGSTTDSVSLPQRQTTVTRAALYLNALLHGLASVGMALGVDPHAAAQPNMGRRAAAAGIAGAFMLAFVAVRLRRDPLLILMPLVFVLCNLIDTIYEFLVTGDPSNIAPAVPETTFLIVYVLFVATVRPISSGAIRVRS